MTENITYLIAHTPRTGSNWLCEVLFHAGNAGNVDPNRAGLFVGYGPGLAKPGVYPDKIDEYFTDSTTANGVCGMKSDWGYLDMLDSHFPAGALDAILKRYTHFIYLYREDVVAQAVSWYIAAKSGVFTSVNRNAPGKGDPLAVAYDRAEIAQRIERITDADNRWRTYFEAHAIDALWINTEAMVAKGGMTKAVRAIYKHLGIAAPRVFKTQHTLQKMDNPLKAEFVERYNVGD